jgi:hypothetical protein
MATTTQRRNTNVVPVSLKPAVRHAIFECCASGEVGGPEVRDLVLEGLRARGWDEKRIAEEYHEYAARCIRNDEPNAFTGERL